MPSAIPSQITDATPMHVSFNKHCVFVGPSKGSRDLTIKFVRTNRVAEDIHVHEAPFPQHWKRDTPPLYNGRFPLYNVADFRKTIPPDASTQRGFFFPMYQHDAMWIQFESSSPFIVKVFAGGTNVLSGEPMEEDTATMTGRSELFRAQQNIQDYIVLPKQLWIDRIAERESIAKQFTATLPSSGPSVAAQILGEDKMKVLHFQITPAKHLNTAIHEIACKKIVVGAGTIFYCPFAPAMTVEDLKYAIMKKEGIPVCQQALICRVRLYDDDATLSEYGIDVHDMIYVALDSRPWSPAYKDQGAGRSSFQKVYRDDSKADRWDAKRMTSFSVQMMNTDCFTKVTGLGPPSYHMTSMAFAKSHEAYFELYHEPETVAVDVKADLQDVKAVDMLEKASGEGSGQDPLNAVSQSTNSSSSCLDTDEISQPFRHISELKASARDFVVSVGARDEAPARVLPILRLR